MILFYAIIFSNLFTLKVIAVPNVKQHNKAGIKKQHPVIPLYSLYFWYVYSNANLISKTIVFFVYFLPKNFANWFKLLINPNFHLTCRKTFYIYFLLTYPRKMQALHCSYMLILANIFRNK
jgi:hypothetical protein